MNENKIVRETISVIVVVIFLINFFLSSCIFDNGLKVFRFKYSSGVISFFSYNLLLF